jgi:hypothetical protein
MAFALGRAGPAPAPTALGFFVRAGRAAGRAPGLALALYAPSALLALLTAAPMLAVMRGLASSGPWADRLAAGDYLNVLTEAGASAAGMAALGGAEPGSTGVSAAAVALALLAPPLGIALQALAYAVVAGGVLARLGGDPAEPLARAGARWLWPMVRFELMAVALIGLLGLLGAGALGLAGALALDRLGGVPLGLAAGSGATPLLVTGGVVVAWVAWVGAINGLLEVGRADMVWRGERGAARALGRALALVGRPRLLAGACLAWLGLGALAGLWALGAAAAGALGPGGLLAGFALQQVVALAGAWLKLLRLAVALEIARSAGAGSGAPVRGQDAR